MPWLASDQLNAKASSWTYQDKDTISVTAHEDKIVLFN